MNHQELTQLVQLLAKARDLWGPQEIGNVIAFLLSKYRA